MTTLYDEASTFLEDKIRRLSYTEYAVFRALILEDRRASYLIKNLDNSSNNDRVREIFSKLSGE